jgi:uncharacterized membrane protein YciS (DUF1049 family)
MTTLLVTYAVAWVAIAAFALKLAVENARLERRMNRLQAPTRLSPASEDSSNQAA